MNKELLVHKQALIEGQLMMIEAVLDTTPEALMDFLLATKTQLELDKLKGESNE